MKKHLLISLFALFSFSSSWAGVKIDATNFPDIAFRQTLIAQDYGKDEYLTDEEIANVKILTLVSTVTNMKGIEFFTALENLYFGCSLDDVDLSHNNELKYLTISGRISSLELLNHPKLISVRCSGCHLESINLSGCSALSSLECEENSLTYLDLSKNSQLTELICYRNKLTEIIFPTTKNLSNIDCHENEIKLLDLSGYTSLNKLNATFNQLTSLDLSNCDKLQEIECYFNVLNSLNITGCIKLTKLLCTDNKLKALTTDHCFSLTHLWCDQNNLTSLDVSDCLSLIELRCSDNQLTTLDVSKCTMLKWLSCSCNQLTTLDVSKNQSLISLSCYSNKIYGDGMSNLINSLRLPKDGELNLLYSTNEGNIITLSQLCNLKSKNLIPLYHDANSDSWKEYIMNISIDKSNFPDEKFLSYLLDQEFASDGILSDIEAAAIRNMNISNKSIYNLHGIEYFPMLSSLSCDFNYLNILDLSECVNLESLNCQSNQLTSLNLSKYNNLISLDCGSNQLTSLDVSECVKLEFLDCHSNKLTSGLNITGCSSIAKLLCYQNNIMEKNMDELISSLPIREMPGSYNEFNVIYNFDEQNVINTSQVSAAKQKGWLPMIYEQDASNPDLYEWKPYSGSEIGLAIDATNFPDENFRKYILNQEYGDGGVLTDEEITQIKYMSPENIGAKSLQGIEYFVELNSLTCNNNQLTTLDVSKNHKLTMLLCSYNNITSLDLSKNDKLTSLYCGSNQLTSLDLSNNNKLTTLSCSNNQLASLDVTMCSSLSRLVCGNNQLENIDLSKCTMLKWLSCNDNKLTSLDLSNNIWLDNAHFYHNNINGVGMDALLTNLPTVNKGWMNMLYLENDQNVMTTLQVAAAKAKGWVPSYSTDGQMWYEYAGSQPTAIDFIKEDTKGLYPYYDLNGRKLDGVPTQKGVYIQNGKKVVIK